MYSGECNGNNTCNTASTFPPANQQHGYSFPRQTFSFLVVGRWLQWSHAGGVLILTRFTYLHETFPPKNRCGSRAIAPTLTFGSRQPGRQNAWSTTAPVVAGPKKEEGSPLTPLTMGDLMCHFQTRPRVHLWGLMYVVQCIFWMFFFFWCERCTHRNVFF